MSAQIVDADSMQWYRNNQPIPGANKDTLVYTQGGLFYLRIFRGNGKECMDQSGNIRVFMTHPRANDDYVIVPLGKPVTIDVLANDDPNCGPFDKNTFRITGLPAIGTLVSAEKGIVVYKPPSTLLGTDKFTYTVEDKEGRITNVATVTLELYIDCAMLYPNPVEDVMNVTVNKKKIHTIRIFDATGRETFRSPVNENNFSIDMHEYAQGMYIVELIEHDGPGCVFRVMKK
jgi:hypothetical protein